jgi:hypothetical protein
VRLAPEVHGIVEPRHASVEPLVAAFAQGDAAAGLDRRARQVANAHDVAIDADNHRSQSAIGAAQVTQPAEQEFVVGRAIQREVAIDRAHDGEAAGSRGKVDAAALVAQLRAALGGCCRTGG